MGDDMGRLIASMLSAGLDTNAAAWARVAEEGSDAWALLAVGARRLHDVGRSAWFLLLGLVPVVGTLVLLYFMVQPSQPESNEYGPPSGAMPAGV